jgi:hypothetical protein
MKLTEIKIGIACEGGECGRCRFGVVGIHFGLKPGNWGGGACTLFRKNTENGKRPPECMAAGEEAKQ